VSLSEDIEILISSEAGDLTPEEQRYLIKALQRIDESKDELDVSGIKAFLDVDYAEIPVSINQFIDDPRYLGRSLVDERSGLCMVYPYWRDALNLVFNSTATEVIFTGPIGSGKSNGISISMAYILHQVLCLRDPFSYFQLVRSSPITFLFFSLSMDLGSSNLFRGFQNLLINSPWFRERGTIVGKSQMSVQFYAQNIEYSIGSPRKAGYGITGKNVVAGGLDEISEVATRREVDAGSSMKFTNMKALRIYQGVARRMESRFAQGGRVPGKLFLASSKQDEAAFLERYVDEVKERPNVLIFDDPIWEIKPKRFYPSGDTFNLAVGDRFHDSRVMEDDEDEDELIKQGYDIIYPPIELKAAFEMDAVGALRDYAGMSASMSRRSKLIARAEYLNRCVLPSLEHPFTAEVFLGEDDNAGIEDYFKWRDEFASAAYRYIHVDLALNGCAAGMAMCHRSGVRSVERVNEGDGTAVTLRDTVVRYDFMLQMRNVTGGNIPFWKIRRFILYLRRKGVRISCVTFDGWQSVDSRQLLNHAGVTSDLLSLDKNDIPYVTFRNAVYEQRVEYYMYAPLIKEAAELEHNRIRKKVDHPEGDSFSKDVSDAAAGCLFKCLEEGSQPEPAKSVEALEQVVESNRSGLDPLWWQSDW
jgi:hypothetical protein